MSTTSAESGTRPLRLGFPVKVLGREDLPSNDARRWKSGPHLRVSLGYLRAIFDYLEGHGFRMYRMSSDLAPYATHPDLPQFHGQIRECSDELCELGKRARDLDLRLSFHPSQYVVLNSPDPSLNAKGIADLLAQAEMLDRMELGPESVLVIHVGGAYGDRRSAAARWAETYRGLPEPVRRRLVLENDDTRFSSAEVLAIHEATGVPLVFDLQHHQCLNPEGLAVEEALTRFVRTWPGGVRPKVHLSSPRTEFREVSRKDRATGKARTVMAPPIWTGHADFLHPFEAIGFLRTAARLGLEFDVMVEAKAKDLAVLRLRRDLSIYAPDLAPRYGLPAYADGEPDSVEAEDGEVDAD